MVNVSKIVQRNTVYHNIALLGTEELTAADQIEQEQDIPQEDENDAEEENQHIVVVDEDTAHLIHQGQNRIF